jgi:DNA mismatch repair protein MutL
MGPQMALSLPLGASRRKAAADAEAAIRGDDLVQGETGEIPVWQLHRRYVLAPVKNGVIVIDQQLAHQRIVFEQVMERFGAAPGSGQRLLFPLTVDLGLQEVELARRAIPFLEKMGFGIRDFGGNTVVIDAIPQDIKDWQDGRLFREILGDLSEAEGVSDEPASDADPRSPLERALAASYARHTAVGRDVALSTREMQALIDQLFATREPFVSPGGRPTVARIPLDEIDRRFGR